jgi:hypothetical protein
MGTVILADVTELETIKISELDEATSMGDADVIPGVKDSATKKIKKSNYLIDLIASTPLSGQYRITGIRLDADKKIVITYDETPEP